MPELLDAALVQTFAKDKDWLQETKLPIVTVSATFREDIKGFHGLPEDESIPDIVFSRAHYSMALGVAVAAWGRKMDWRKAWIVDPTNYVSHRDWRSVEITQLIGKTLARRPLLKMIKDFVDKFGRGKLPILDSITPPLLHLAKSVKRPILSLHVASGNILAGTGKRVLQVITDPHVRYDYLYQAENPNMFFAVFDDRTKQDFLEKAALAGKKADAKRLIVTGPPIDPRVVRCRVRKQPWRSGKLRLCLTTGGLGTNKVELLKILEQLLPELRKKNSAYQLLVYAATHGDIAKEARELAKKHRVRVDAVDKKSAALRILYHPQIVDANEMLIKHGFSWADGFITKPSGDMAYDAVAAGCFLLTLQEWGEWEHVIRKIFELKEIARPAVVDQISQQLAALTSAKGKSQSWVEKAMHNAHAIDPLFLHGSEKIIEAYEQISKKTT